MGRTISLPNLLFSLAILVYIVISKLVFDNVYLTSKQVIDEEFHIPQGLAYCNLQFDTVSKGTTICCYIVCLLLFVIVGSQNYHTPRTLFSINGAFSPTRFVSHILVTFRQFSSVSIEHYIVLYFAELLQQEGNFMEKPLFLH